MVTHIQKCKYTYIHIIYTYIYIYMLYTIAKKDTNKKEKKT